MKVVKYILTILYCLIGLVIIGIPIYFCFINSFKTNVEIYSDFFGLPESFNFSNFSYLFLQRGMWKYILNSIIVTLIVSALSFLINPFIAYKIAMNWEKKLIRVIYYIISSTMLIPSQVILFPLIKEFYALNLMNLFGLIIYYAVFMIPESIFLLVPHFRLFKKKLRNAAYLDGCNEFNFYFRIFLPVCKPVIMTVVILNTIWAWNDFFMPLLILSGNSETWTLPIFMYSFIGTYTSNKGYVFAACQVALIPMILLYFVFHKRIINGFSTKNDKVK